MSQNLADTQSADSLAGGGTGTKTTVSGTTGSTCTRSGLYKASDGKTVFILAFELNQLYPPYPGGNGKKSCTWTSLATTESGDASGSFKGVIVPAGTA